MPHAKMFQTVRHLELRQLHPSLSTTNALMAQFIYRFQHLENLIVSCIYSPLIPLRHTKNGQVDRLKLIVDKCIDENFFR